MPEGVGYAKLPEQKSGGKLKMGKKKRTAAQAALASYMKKGKAVTKSDARPDPLLKSKAKDQPTKSDAYGQLAKGLGTAALAISGKSTAGGILKGALAGAAAGASIDSAISTYKESKKTKNVDKSVPKYKAPKASAQTPTKAPMKEEASIPSKMVMKIASKKKKTVSLSSSNKKRAKDNAIKMGY